MGDGDIEGLSHIYCLNMIIDNIEVFPLRTVNKCEIVFREPAQEFVGVCVCVCVCVWGGGADVGVTFGMFHITCVLRFELFLLIFSECLLLDFGGISSIRLPIDCSG